MEDDDALLVLARCGAAQGLRVDYATALGDDALSDGLLQRWQASREARMLARRAIPDALWRLTLLPLAAKILSGLSEGLAPLPPVSPPDESSGPPEEGYL